MPAEIVRTLVVALVVAGLVSRLGVTTVAAAVLLDLALWITFPVGLGHLPARAGKACCHRFRRLAREASHHHDRGERVALRRSSSCQAWSRACHAERRDLEALGYIQEWLFA
jgi:hypothetical protein